MSEPVTICPVTFDPNTIVLKDNLLSNLSRVYDHDLNIGGLNINELPQGFTVHGYLNLHGSQIKHLPRGLTVKGYLDISHTDIAYLPPDLFVGGSIFLNHTQIKRLPDDLKINGALDLRDCPIDYLPHGLVVKNGYLDISGSKITILPPDLKRVGKGSLFLSKTGITNLPEDLYVDGSLDLSYTQIKYLPKNLSVSGYLNLNHTQILILPKDLRLGGFIFIQGCTRSLIVRANSLEKRGKISIGNYSKFETSNVAHIFQPASL